METVKYNYTSPAIERVELDNDISLALESAPPGGPGETVNVAPHYFNGNPFKVNNI